MFYILFPFYRQENHNETLNCSSGAQVGHGEYKIWGKYECPNSWIPMCQKAGWVKIQQVCEKAAGVGWCVFFQTFAEKAEKTWLMGWRIIYCQETDEQLVFILLLKQLHSLHRLLYPTPPPGDPSIHTLWIMLLYLLMTAFLKILGHFYKRKGLMRYEICPEQIVKYGWDSPPEKIIKFICFVKQCHSYF